MSQKLLPRGEALEDISSWNTNNVIRLLRKNGLDECCEAVAKRQIDGDGLLHLTEGKLALWKSDLTRPLIWSLWTFVEDVKKFPEKYAEIKKSACTQDNAPQENNEDVSSDGSSWGTDFDDEDVEDSLHTKTSKDEVEKCQRNGKEKETEDKIERNSVIGTSDPQDESTYANCEPLDEDNNIYANLEKNPLKKLPTKNISQLHSPSNDVNLSEQFKEQSQLGNMKKPTIGPKPDNLIAAVKKIVPSKQPQKSFLHDTSKSKKITAVSNDGKRTSATSFSELNNEQDKSVTTLDKCLKEFLLKPPATIRNFDLVANLPTRVDESEDEYEPVDKQIGDQYQRSQIISRVDSKQSLASGHRSSVESIYQSPSTTSHEGEVEEPYEIYESITESPEDDGYYLSPISWRLVEPGIPPPLPAKLLQSTSQSCLTPPSRPITEKPRERSPDKKSATLPHSGSNVSLSSERATRPLPPPPERQSYTDKPWFHNVTREQATVMIKDQGTYGNQRDGYFLLRPSTTNINNPLALVLWYKDRVYNVPVRKRHDNRYALGSEKVKEQTFASVEEIVNFYSREELVLHTGGVQAGSTKLTDSPPK